MNLVPSNPSVTMTSLELVDYINSQREEGEPVLAHSDFLKKVPQVLGAEVAGNFSCYYKASNGKQNPMYRFAKREACLMAMSYSYDLQAKVFDKMTDLEQKASGIAPSVPVTFAEALRLAADLAEQKQFAEKARDEAIATKALIGTRREAQAMNRASQEAKRANSLEIQLDESMQYATVKRMQMVHHGQPFKWRHLRDTAVQMSIPPIDVFDANYGTVKAYHADVWREAYAVEIAGQLEGA